MQSDPIDHINVSMRFKAHTIYGISSCLRKLKGIKFMKEIDKISEIVFELTIKGSGLNEVYTEVDDDLIQILEKFIKYDEIALIHSEIRNELVKMLDPENKHRLNLVSSHRYLTEKARKRKCEKSKNTKEKRLKQREKAQANPIELSETDEETEDEDDDFVAISTYSSRGGGGSGGSGAK
jgi:hypothetical protein